MIEGPKILAFGGAYLDFNASFPIDKLKPGEEIIGGEYKVLPGGSPVNFARAANSMGVESVFVGKLGDDVVGKAVQQLSRDSRLPTRYIVDKNVQTNVGINLTGEDEKQEMMVLGTANQSLSVEDVRRALQEFGPTAEYVYVGSCFKLDALLPSFSRLAKYAKSMDIQIILDHGRIDPTTSEATLRLVRNAMPYVDYYLPSMDEFLGLWGTNNFNKALDKARKKAPQTTVVVKDARNGAVGYKGDFGVGVSGYNLDGKEIRPTGAGDNFNAGFITSIRDGAELADAIQYGCATAAIKISEEGDPTRERVDKFIASNVR